MFTALRKITSLEAKKEKEHYQTPPYSNTTMTMINK